MSPSNVSKPIKDFKSGPVQASVWRNETKKSGKTSVRCSIRIYKQYRNEAGDFETTEYYFPDDLPKLALVAKKAYEYICLNESQEPDTIPV